jgi:hypothetical protein
VPGLFYPETSGRSLEDMEVLFNPDFRPRTDLESEAERYQDEDDDDADSPVSPRRQSAHSHQLQPLLAGLADEEEA